MIKALNRNLKKI